MIFKFPILQKTSDHRRRLDRTMTERDSLQDEEFAAIRKLNGEADSFDELDEPESEVHDA